FSGYVDLVHRKAWSWDGSKEVEIPIPDGLTHEVARRRAQLLAAAAEADDDVLTKYLEGEEVSDPELEACLRKGVKESVLAPVLVGSAAKGIGFPALLGAFSPYRPPPPPLAPSPPPPADGAPATAIDPKTSDPIELPPDPAGPLLVRVFKTTA